MNRQARIRAELEKEEARANKCWERMCGEYFIAYQMVAQEQYNFAMSRRRFFLRDLLRVQLKEFNHD